MSGKRDLVGRTAFNPAPSVAGKRMGAVCAHRVGIGKTSCEET